MSKRLMLCAAILACTAVGAQAEQPHREKPSRVYATYAHCSPSNHLDPSHLQPGELSIMIQDRGYRESIGSSLDAGECW